MGGEMQTRRRQQQEVTSRDTHLVQDNRLNTNLLYCTVISLLQFHWGLRRNKNK